MRPLGSGGWWAIEIHCHIELVKAVLWRLRGPGHRAVAVRRSGHDRVIHAYLERAAAPPDTVSGLALSVSSDAQERGFPQPRVTWRSVVSWDWPDEMKRFMVPHSVGNRLLVLPHWVPAPETDRITLRLDGRFGFGAAGIHPTTHMCLEALERKLTESAGAGDVTVADIGCGAGILSVATALLGAKHVYAVDTKAAAVAGTLANLRLNRIGAERAAVAQGGVSRLREILPGPPDGFVCNILAQIIVPLIPRFADIAQPGTWGLLSGIREEELRLLGAPLEVHGWRTSHVQRRSGWCCVEIERRDD